MFSLQGEKGAISGADKQGARNTLLFIFSCVFLALFAVLWAASFFFPNNDFVTFNVLINVLVAVVFAAVLCAACAIGRRLPETCFFYRHTSVCVALFLLCLLPLQGVLLFNVYFQPGWDVSILTESGYWLATGRGIPTNHHSYFASYPNNITLLLIWAYLFKALIAVFGYYDYLFAAIMAGAVMADVALFVCYRFASRLCGRRKAIIALICGVPLIAFAPWLTLPYSDTMSILFPILSLDLFELATRQKSTVKKVLLGAAAGVLIGAGTMIKPTVTVMLVAIALAWLLATKGREAMKSLALILACTIICYGATYAVISKVNANTLISSGITEEYSESVRFPATHFLMMGMQKQPSPFNPERYQYGKWFGDDVVTTSNAVGQDAKHWANFQVIKQRLSDFGPVGYLQFLFDKARWVLGDGTMYYGGEVQDVPPSFQQTDFAKGVQYFYWYGSEGYFTYLAQFLQGVWLIVVALIWLPIFKKPQPRRPQDVRLAALRLAVFGILLFILLFEGRSRYLTNFLPVFLALAAYGVPSVPEYLFKKRLNKA